MTVVVFGQLAYCQPRFIARLILGERKSQDLARHVFGHEASLFNSPGSAKTRQFFLLILVKIMLNRISHLFEPDTPLNPRPASKRLGLAATIESKIGFNYGKLTDEIAAKFLAVDLLRDPQLTLIAAQELLFKSPMQDDAHRAVLCLGLIDCALKLLDAEIGDTLCKKLGFECETERYALAGEFAQIAIYNLPDGHDAVGKAGNILFRCAMRLGQDFDYDTWEIVPTADFSRLCKSMQFVLAVANATDPSTRPYRAAEALFNRLSNTAFQAIGNHPQQFCITMIGLANRCDRNNGAVDWPIAGFKLGLQKCTPTLGLEILQTTNEQCSAARTRQLSLYKPPTDHVSASLRSIKSHVAQRLSAHYGHQGRQF